MLPQRITRFGFVIAFVLAFLFLGYELRSRYTDPFYVNFDDGSSWPVLQEQSPTTSFDKVVVMAKMPTEDTDWVARDLPDWGHAIYHMDDPASDYHPPENKGREAMAYLTYLIDMYDSLPSTIAFIHPHEAGWPQAWHTDAEDYSNAKSLQSLKIDYVQKHGYANLRCLESPGCPDEIQPFRDPYDEGRSAEHAFAGAYIFMFGGDNSTVPQVFATPCCSQLAVANWQVRERPKSQYERVRQWILDTPLDDEMYTPVGANNSGGVDGKKGSASVWKVSSKGTKVRMKSPAGIRHSVRESMGNQSSMEAALLFDRQKLVQKIRISRHRSS